ncbi:MAG: type II toxin-antitoxin system HicA family toxin [Rickettsiales bacterium]|nr:MAG: type II toxin-antitoxin system HicA family toxin [Rickettsiales bacterium]
MKNINSRDLIKIIEKDGWYLVNVVGSHQQFKHKIKKGKVTIPHPKAELTTKTIKSILKQAEINGG